MYRLITLIALMHCVIIHALAQVTVEQTKLSIPTYETGAPESVPNFYLPEVYQNASLRVYPYANINRLSKNKVDKAYTAIYLENKYLKVCILPELGGRLYTAVDKVNGYDIFYRNNVVKPSLIGMTGAWISGGVEWNIPHHHRSSTFMPVDYKIDSNKDGSKTVWVGEYEKRSQTRWAVGLTLHNDKSYIEVTIKHLNVTPVMNSFLVWANAAVASNKDYQVILPPDVERVTYHTKNEFSDYPVSNQIYQGIDFRNVDVSWWKNTFSPTSFFAWDSKMDFSAGIDHGRKAGTICVGDHHVFTGQKFWNWGNNEVQRLWDQMLTDTDGPYLELMTGMYSDNQPDYAWNSPFDTKEGTMYYFPIKNMNSVKNATKDALLNLDVVKNNAEIQINVTSVMNNCELIVSANGQTLSSEKVNIVPETALVRSIKLPKGSTAADVKAVLKDTKGEEIISFQQLTKKNKPEPEPYVHPLPPAQIESAEKLYRIGVRLEQLHSAIYEPVMYYQEALKRDSNHILTNVKIGEFYLKNFQYEKAKKHLQRALNVETKFYTTAKNAEPVYYLGLLNYYQNDLNNAYDLFYKATWSSEWAAQSYYMLALIDCNRGKYTVASEMLEKSLARNANNVEALVLKALLARISNSDATQILAQAEKTDPLNLTVAFEKFKNSSVTGYTLEQFTTLMRDEADNYLETAARYISAGFYNDALAVLSIATSNSKIKNNPLVAYYQGYCKLQAGNRNEAIELFNKAAKANWDYCFPYGNTSATVLNAVLEINSNDATAMYLLANLLCDFQPETAYNLWKKSAQINPQAITYRNIAFVEANIFGNIDLALKNIEQAMKLDSKHLNYVLEYDFYAEYKGISPAERLSHLERKLDLVSKWDKTDLRRLELYTTLGKYDEAIRLLNTQHFFVAEKTTINPHSYWTYAYLMRGINRFNANNIDLAIADFNEILRFPRNLEISRDSKVVIANYWLAKAYQKKGNKKKAAEYFTLMANYKMQYPGWGAMKNPLIEYYKALASKELGNAADAEMVINKMISTGNAQVNKIYHSALQDKTLKIQFAHKLEKADGYMYLALASLLQNNTEKTRQNMQAALQILPSNIEANFCKNYLPKY